MRRTGSWFLVHGSWLFAVILFLLITHNLLLITPVFAAGEFASSYNITYDVDSSGVTSVQEDITLKNLTERFYASSFNLTIGATQISDVSASDSQGSIPVEVTKTGTKTNISVKFSQQVVGKDKEYPWILKFKSKDFAQAQGKTWQVSIPKISSLENLDNYNLTLSTPISFGDPTSISPTPAKQMESAGKLVFIFTKDQLSDSGILANFGTNQLFDFKLTFNISNNGIVPALVKLPLPPETPLQQVIIKNIYPKPEDVILDGDGNYIGWFKLDRKQSLKVTVEGLAKLSLKSDQKLSLSSDEQVAYLSTQKYWEKDTPQIRSKLAEIFKDHNPKTNQEKARLIHKFVSTFLQYDQARLKSKDFQRFGALTALSNPDKSLCLEFSDLFIALARAADIPSREIVGFGYTSNPDLRPQSFSDNVLHAWPEYFDPNVGWVMIDPTWENTTGGVDYFSKLDLNHLVLLKRGLSSEEPSPASDVSVNFSESEFLPISQLNLSIDAPSEIFAAFPAKVKVRVENIGNTIAPESILSLSAAKLNIVGNSPLGVPALPPYGFSEYTYDLRTNKLWESYDDILLLKDGDQKVEKKITVKPFFAYNYFAFGVLGLMGGMIAVYGGILYMRLKARKTPKVL